MIIQYLRLAWIFIKIGVFTIGGGYAMLPLINSELISNGLMSATEVADMIALAQMTPGPFAINAATFSGVRTLGLFGGIIPSIAVTVPSLIITTLLAKYFFKFSDNIIVRRAMWGLRPAVTGLIAAAAVIMAVPSLFGVDTLSGMSFSDVAKSLDLASLTIAIAAGVTMIKFKVSPIWVVLASGVIGLVVFGVLGI